MTRVGLEQLASALPSSSMRRQYSKSAPKSSQSTKNFQSSLAPRYPGLRRPVQSPTLDAISQHDLPRRSRSSSFKFVPPFRSLWPLNAKKSNSGTPEGLESGPSCHSIQAYRHPIRSMVEIATAVNSHTAHGSPASRGIDSPPTAVVCMSSGRG